MEVRALIQSEGYPEYLLSPYGPLSGESFGGILRCDETKPSKKGGGKEGGLRRGEELPGGGSHLTLTLTLTLIEELPGGRLPMGQDPFDKRVMMHTDCTSQVDRTSTRITHVSSLSHGHVRVDKGTVGLEVPAQAKCGIESLFESDAAVKDTAFGGSQMKDLTLTLTLPLKTRRSEDHK